jgi:hypothetical protein
MTTFRQFGALEGLLSQAGQKHSQIKHRYNIAFFVVLVNGFAPVKIKLTHCA